MADTATTSRSRAAGLFAFIYGAAAYLLFVVVFVYAIAFIADAAFVPKTIDHGGFGDGSLTATAVLVDVALLLLFAVQHSAMARPAFKRWWTRYVPASVERSTYVVAASVCLAALLAFWWPISATLWDVTGQPWRGLLVAVSMLGWVIALTSTFLINHFDLFGLRQVFLRLRERHPGPNSFATPAFYRLVRHPLYLGFLIAFWVTPTMTAGHLLFAAATTGYILVAIQLEERDLVGTFGHEYREYRRRVPMLIPGVRTNRG